MLASVCGALLCLGMHLLLRRGGHSPWKMMPCAIALALPAAALLDLAGAAIWRLFSSHYIAHPPRWLHPQELIEDYLTYLWVFVSWSALYVGAANAIEVRRRDQRLAAAEAARAPAYRRTPASLLSSLVYLSIKVLRVLGLTAVRIQLVQQLEGPARGRRVFHDVA